MTERLVLLGFRAAWLLVPRLPERWTSPVFNLLADLAWLRNGRGVRRLQSNLARVAGLGSDSQAARDLSRRAMRSYARYWREMFALSGMDDAEIDRRVQVLGAEHLDAALAQGRGVVLAATHSGNWDLGGAWVTRHYGGATTVAERVRPEALFEAFVAERRRHGIEVLPHEGGAEPPFRVLLERLRAGRLVGLVSDRDLSSNGVEVTFFGATARMAAGPAALARVAGAPLLPVAVWNEGPCTVVRFHPPLSVERGGDVAPVIQALADVFAIDIAAHPADWHMLQRVWVEGMDPR